MTKRGGYRDRVTFNRNNPGRTADTDGHRPESAQSRFVRWAEVIPVKGRERFLAMQTQSDITYRVRVRYDDETKTVEPDWWLVLADGTRLNIVRIYDPDRGHRSLEMECNERIT